MKKVIVTGAGGFIGGSLVKRLLELGVKVYGVDISERALERFSGSELFHPVIADFSKYPELDKLISEREFDCFIHTAWLGSFVGKDCYNYSLHNKNITPICIACEKAYELGVKRFVFCGSSYQNMISESADYPVNYYGIVKKASADYCLAICQKNKMECNIAILTNTYGFGDISSKAVNTFIRKMLKNDPLDLVTGTRPNDWVYVDDTVEGIISVAESPYSGKKYYVGHRDISTFKDKLIAMKEALNSGSELNFGKYPDNTFVDYSPFNADELYSDTGFECSCDFRESILKTAEWVKTLNWGEN